MIERIEHPVGKTLHAEDDPAHVILFIAHQYKAPCGCSCFSGMTPGGIFTGRMADGPPEPGTAIMPCSEEHIEKSTAAHEELQRLLKVKRGSTNIDDSIIAAMETVFG